MKLQFFKRAVVEVDYVIAWVDGQDPAHMAARQEFAPNSGRTHFEAVTTERYLDNGEIYYNIASVIKFAPFVRRIFIITDNQKPRLLDAFKDESKCDGSLIQVVSHDDIFEGLPAARPSFNARAIEGAMWRIPGLSEHFVYSNDDFFVNAPLSEVDLFENRRPVLHGDWERPENTRWKYKLRHLFGKISGHEYTFPKFRMAQWKGAVAAGVTDRFVSIHHHPHPLRRSTLPSFFAENPEVLNRQVGFRYRDIEQFNTVSLANHLEIFRHNASVRPARDLAYLDFVQPKRWAEEFDKISTGSAPFGCVQGFERFTPEFRARIHQTLIAKFDDVLPDAIKAYLSGDKNGSRQAA
ncbi:hypothetical protein FHS76_002569 [Ochrobactrum daejeonense]|uniref:Stealth protein CR2 conserved region 2 domain-containing protein n=1 Tax=Brucella daejeonensis TaxID=659015 RepID=A0A7W9AY07_9HYPH|nr:hypothetical protein [Brucella daejeonensis]MBB5702685.1 hypothetical protein [Brucella daejeonensis]